MARKRRLRAKNRMGVVVPYDIAAQDVTLNSGKDLETDLTGIKQAIRTLHATLGNYAFPGGKPDISFDGGGGGGSTDTADISYTLGAKVTAQGAGNLITLYDELNVQLGTDDNLYVIDPSTVRVTMGGIEQQDVYDEDTDIIHIAVVTGDVEIEAEVMTYVGYNMLNGPLVMFLDGLNKGNESGKWKSLVGNIEFALNNACVINSDNVQFNGSAKGTSNNTLNVMYSEGSIESIFDVSASEFPTYPKVQHILTNNVSNGISMGLGFAPLLNNSPCYCCVNGMADVDYGTEVTGIPGVNETIKTKQHIYYEKNSCYRNGQTQLSITENVVRFVCDNTSPLAIGYRGRALNGTPNEQFLVGKIFCIRVYSRTLTSTERMQNYKVDKKRFNLA